MFFLLKSKDKVREKQVENAGPVPGHEKDANLPAIIGEAEAAVLKKLKNLDL